MLLALSVSIRYWRTGRNPLHLAYAVAAAGWFIYLLGSSAGGIFQNKPLVFFLTHAAGQVAIVALLFFFLISASVIRFETHAVWMIQGISGLLLLAWNSWAPWLQDWAYTLWLGLNIACIIALCGHGALKVHQLDSHHKRRWLALGGCLLGLGICVADALKVGAPPLGNMPAHYLYAVFLLVLGLLIFTRASRLSVTLKGAGAAHTTAWDAITGFGPPSDSVASAIAGERRRIAQDLHDGVCSQLVSILATLDTHAPQQQAVALALEQCLVDLKIMVDVIDDADDSLIDALGRLRYRVQRGLDTLGIKMRWTVDVYGPLQNLHGETAKQVLRITQECLSNVMRHSHASAVEVICSYLPANNFMLLEVRDNGSGIPSREAGRPGGKGLENMQKRARSLGGHLQIFTKPGGGTGVRLLVPLPASKRSG
jgi:signal transduction histidine kinase